MIYFLCPIYLCDKKCVIILSILIVFIFNFYYIYLIFFIYDSLLRYFTNLQVRPLSSATRPFTASSSEIVAKLNSPLPLPQIWKFSPT